MKIIVFGLSVTSSWGNGHATLLRGLFRALYGQGHEITFFELDTPYYAAHRDATELPFVNTVLYSSWHEWLPAIKRHLADAEAGMVTSYCPHGSEASELLLDAPHIRSVFYDMDTPVTFSELDRGQLPRYLPRDGLAGFDLVLSYTGGIALHELRTRLGARNVAPLYGWVDPDFYSRVPGRPEFEAALSYIGTYSADRQLNLEKMLIEPALTMPEKTFVIGGAMYANREQWPKNIRYFDHVSPPDHPAFYSSSAVTLNITRGAMAKMGFCPSGRLFEAAACGTPVLSDWWEGLDTFFKPDEEILIASSTGDAIAALQLDKISLAEIGTRARQRVMDCHTAGARAERLIQLIEDPQRASEETESGVYEGVQ